MNPFYNLCNFNVSRKSTYKYIKLNSKTLQKNWFFRENPTTNKYVDILLCFISDAGNVQEKHGFD